MKSGLYARLVLACAILLSVLLTGLGIVLGQFFPLFAGNTDLTIQHHYWLYLITVLVVAFLISLFVAARMMLQYAKPIDEITRIAVRIAEGDYLARTRMNGPEYDNELSIAINKIASNLQEMSLLRTMENERLKTLVESMGSGLLMFGRGGTVNLVNGVLEKTFGLSKKSIMGMTYKEIGLPPVVETLIDDVFMTEQVHESQVQLDGENSTAYVSVYGAPVIGRHGNWLGIVVVMHDITKLIRLEKVRKDFVANVSHELRTPVTSIKGFTETLLEGAMDDPAVMKMFLGIIQKESDRLHLLIDDLLALSGMESEGFTLQYATVDMKDVIDDALSAVSRNLEQKKMKTITNIPGHITIEGDIVRLVQVMVNLLTNAINYSSENKTITISVTDANERIRIEISDEGIGIEHLELPRLFERFYRVDRARSRDSGGTGLGLAIVKHLIESHNGTVDVESEIGVGTTFQIHLPKKQDY
ncbi:ATP-binding protein [Filibacter tadaridae]|uniref:histidine kinase n=1 Tax=Filibacter tadaridae TaxID=2483811 RepID=A0A3P5X7F0_9BACL|nr:ATP-binding protein [Filibacter tadaridae]VDC26721.1 Alkaline phosphatase synthesis sensor protein PhoR [Filibacter tadaridae]